MSMRHFAKIRGLDEVPNETTMLKFRHLLEQHDLSCKLFNRVNAHVSRKDQNLRGDTIVDARSLLHPARPRMIANVIRNAPDHEGQIVILWDEGAHWLG